MRLLVIGDTGFIGSQILSFAKKNGHSVLGLSRRNWEMLELFKKNSDKFDLIINAAGVSNNNKTGCEYIYGNLKISKEISHAFSFSNIPLVHISAACIYNNTNSEIINEDSSIVDPTAYSLSKLCSEIIFNESKFPSLNLRLPAVLGLNAPTSWPVRLLNNKNKGIKNIILNPYNLYNHVIHVDNLCEFILSKDLCSAIKKNHKKTLNLYSKDPITFYEAAKVLLDSETFDCEELGKKSSILHSNFAITEFNFHPWTVLEALNNFKLNYHEG